AFDAYLRVIYDEHDAGPQIGKDEPRQTQLPRRSSFRFAHGASYNLPGGLPRLYAAYHPSQQNTQTGRLTPEMFRLVLEDIRNFLAEGT
ncbi:MAG: hypothetical protein ACRD2G_17265, partial [Terriglobia bacterium]